MPGRKRREAVNIRRNRPNGRHLNTAAGKSILQDALCREFRDEQKTMDVHVSLPQIPLTPQRFRRKAMTVSRASGTAWLPAATQRRFKPGQYEGHSVWGGSPNFPDLIARVMDEDITSTDCTATEHEALPFVRDVGQHDVHFLEGYMGRSTTSFSPKKHLAQANQMANTFHAESMDSPLQRSPAKRQSVLVNHADDAELNKDLHKRCEQQARRASIFAENVDKNAKYIAKRREACESLRVLVFGELPEEHNKPGRTILDYSPIFESKRGTMEEIAKFVDLWLKIDEDDSGDIDFDEFLEFFSKSKTDRLLCMRCVKFLLGSDAKNSLYKADKGSSDKQPEIKAQCRREDMMKLIWLKAGDEDIAAMQQMFDIHKLNCLRAKTPPPLPRKVKKELLENFHFLDRRGEGFITYDDLVRGGLIDYEMMAELQEKYGKKDSEILNQDDFLEMLCPYGYRAHDQVTELANKQDQLLRKVFVDCRHLRVGLKEFKAWLLDSDFQRLQHNCAVELRTSPIRLDEDKVDLR